jgi:TctA family transporter
MDTFINNIVHGSALGLQHALTFNNLLYCFIGCVLGTFLGAMPGIGVLVAISLLFPVTFHLEPTTALIMLGGIYYGTAYGGSIASILLNVPGTPQNAVACIDGYPMARQGRAAIALSMTAVASFIGGSMGILLMMGFSPILAEYALKFGPADYFSLMVLSLVASSAVSDGPPIKGFAMVIFGVALGMVGTDLNTSMQRYTFDFRAIWDGLSLLALAMGMFGATEVIASIRAVQGDLIDRNSVTLRKMMPTWQDLKETIGPAFRGGGIGCLMGILPGTGGFISIFMAYTLEKRLAKDPSRFGKGALEGVVAPEAANNGADQTSFIPTLSLGIPGSPPLALMLGVLLIHGITPGPNLISERPDMFWAVVMSFWVGNLMLLVLNIPMIGIWVRALLIPYHLLYPAIVFFICVGVYTVNNNAIDVWMVVIFTVLGYALRLLDFHPAPLLLGFILGPTIETQMRRTLIFSDGDFMAFFERPISASLLALSFVILAWSMWAARRAPKLTAATATE